MLRGDSEQEEQADDDRGASGEGAGGGPGERGGEYLVEQEEAGRVLPVQVRLGSARCQIHLGIWTGRSRTQHPRR